MTWQAWLFLSLLLLLVTPWPLLYRAHLVRAAKSAVGVPASDDFSPFTASNGWTAVIVDPAQGRPFVLLRDSQHRLRITMGLPHPGGEPAMVDALTAAGEFLNELSPDIHTERNP